MNDRRYLDQLRGIATVLWALVVVMYLMIAFPDTRAWVQGFDDQILTWAVGAEADPLVSIAKVLSFIGSSIIMVPFVIVVAGYLLWKERTTATVFWVSALVFSEALTWISKFAYGGGLNPPGSKRSRSSRQGAVTSKLVSMDETLIHGGV